MHIVLLGAGKAGRGFLARLLKDQAQITFIDCDRELIRKLREFNGYQIRFFDGREPVLIDGFDVFHTEDPGCLPALKNCDAVLVSVRGENTPEAGAWLAGKINEDTCIVACENATLPEALMGPLKDRACSGAVFCTTTEADGFNIESENYPYLHVSSRVSPALAALEGIFVEKDFPLLMLRKIYTYNAASAIISYLGAEKGIEEYARAANDPEIEGVTNAFYHEINAAISAQYGVPLKEQEAFAALSKIKFQSYQIADSVSRNAASPERKLGPQERIIAPARLIASHGGDPSPLFRAAAAALRYMGISSKSKAAEVLRKVSLLTEEDPFMREILKYV